jgi:hypothetical protein
LQQVTVLFGGDVNATLIPEKEDIVVVFSQGSNVGKCDYVAAISREFALAHPGNECNSAHTLPTELNVDENFDRGGLVVFKDGVNQTTIHLLNSGNDTRSIFDPSTWSLTGTYYLCVTRNYPCGADTPGPGDYVFVSGTTIHTHDKCACPLPPPLPHRAQSPS